MLLVLWVEIFGFIVFAVLIGAHAIAKRQSWALLLCLLTSLSIADRFVELIVSPPSTNISPGRLAVRMAVVAGLVIVGVLVRLEDQNDNP